LVFPPRFETVKAAGFVGLRHDAHEIRRQFDPGNSGRASTSRSDHSTIVERPRGRQRGFGVRRPLGRQRGFGVRRPLGLARPLRLAWHLD
jgi:hypothetical protein